MYIQYLIYVLNKVRYIWRICPQIVIKLPFHCATAYGQYWQYTYNTVSCAYCCIRTLWCVPSFQTILNKYQTILHKSDQLIWAETTYAGLLDCLQIRTIFVKP